MAVLSDVIQRGTLAARPAASIAGRLYYDTTNSLLYRDSGSAWESVEAGASAPAAHASTHQSGGSDAFTGIVPGSAFAPAGLTGATAASRYVGATASGAPASGTFAVGDYVLDQTGKVWVCTAAGTPGTWTQVGNPVFTGARAYHSVSQSIANATAVVAALNSERYDSNAYHDTATNNSRMTVPAGLGGKHAIGGHVDWGTGGTGARQTGILLNGVTLIALVQGAASAQGVVHSLSTDYTLIAGDYVEMRFFHTEGAAVTIPASTGYQCEFWIRREG